MALGICFHQGESSINFSQAVMGLDQRFYELLFSYYEKRESDSLLKAMVSIGYDDEFFLGKDQILETLNTLEQIMANGELDHPQTPQFCSVLRDAASRNCGLLVWGDMYPDLSRK